MQTLRCWGCDRDLAGGLYPSHVRRSERGICCVYCGARSHAAKASSSAVPVVVGWAHPRGGVPLDGASGDRLAAMAGFADRSAFMTRVEAYNLWTDSPRPRPDVLARRAQVVFARCVGRRAVLLGRAVSEAMGCPADFLEVATLEGDGVVSVVTALPHPSGRCRAYNDTATVWDAAGILRAFLGLPRPVPCVRCGLPALLDSLVCYRHARTGLRRTA